LLNVNLIAIIFAISGIKLYLPLLACHSVHNFAILSYMKSLSLSRPHMIIMVGVPGSGKSFFAEKFASTFSAPYVCREKIVARLGQDTKEIELVAQDQLEELLKTQASVIVDGLADTRATRGELASKARRAGYDTLLIWVQTDTATAKGRSAKRTGEGTHRILTTEEYDQTAKRFVPPATVEKPVVISGKHTYATQAKVILKKLSEPRANISVHTAAPVRPEQPGRRNITIR
jgi:predicted kinase